MSMNRLTNRLQPLVESLGYEFIGLERSSNPSNPVLRIYINREGGIDLNDCSNVSREVAALLDVEDLISGHYNLEISSPGLDRPLFTLAQFGQFAGEEIQLTLFTPVDGRRKFKGRNLGVKAECIQLDLGGAEITLNFNNIAKARLVPDYDSLMSNPKRQKGQTG